MKSLKYFQGRIRGWLPQEPTFQKTKIAGLNQKTKKPMANRYALTFIVVFAVVFSTLGIFGVLGLNAYGPFAAGVVTVLALIVLNVLILKPRKTQTHENNNQS